MTGEAERVKIDGGFELDVSRDPSRERFYVIEILNQPMNPSDGMKSLGMRILETIILQ
jgi:hypothetical protein